MWRLFPISPGQKTPALPGDWREHSTSDPDQIEAWREAGYDLAVDCGASGLLVVDIDGEEGLATAATMDLPPTYTMRTPRGGEHRYYKGIGPTTVQKLGPKVDTRGVGGYTVWEGPGYEPINGSTVELVPGWVVPRLNVRKDTKPAVATAHDQSKRAIQYLSIRKPAVEGEGGNDHTYQTAAALRDLGVDLDTAIDLMTENWNDRCQPPWDENELNIIICNAYRYGQNEEGAQAFDFDPKERFAAISVEIQQAPEKESRFRLWSLTEAGTRPKIPFIFDGILPGKSFGIAYGPPENGKTWLLIDICMRIALGWTLAGEAVLKPRDVVFFAGEGFEELVHDRCDAWCDYHGVPRRPPHFFLLENFPNITSEDEIDEAVAEIRKRAPDVAMILVDTYARAMAEAGLSENDPLEVMTFVRQMEVLKRGFECTVLAIHHSGKDIDRGSRGSNSLIAAADFAYEITADWAVQTLVLKCAKMKAARHFEPLYYEALEHGAGLVMRGITAAEHKSRSAAPEDQYGHRAVQAAMHKAGAYGDDNAVSSHTLATFIYEPEISEPQMEIDAKLDRIARKLNMLAKGRYAYLVNAKGLWRFPQ